MNLKNKITLLLLISVVVFLRNPAISQVVILQQGFDSTSGSQSNGTWTNVGQIQNGGDDWSNSGTHNVVIEGNNSCSGWSTCNDKTGNTYGISGGAPNFKGTGTNTGYGTTNSSYFAIFDDYDASSGTYGTIFTPTFNLSNYTSCHLTFYWNNANTSSSYIQVQYYNGSSWSSGTNFGTGTGSLGWHQASMSLPSNTTEVVFFIVSDFYYYAIGLDQIEIYGTPNCTLSSSISSSTNVSTCSYNTNGSATVSVSGGTTPYGYSWTPSSGLTGATTTTASGMSESIYTCTVTDHVGCTSTSTVTIGGPAAIRDSISSSNNISCNGGSNGSATVGVKGGASPYTYSWSSSHGTNVTASNLTVGSYTCTVTDHNSCTSTATVTITQPSQLRDSISSSTNVLCNGSLTGSATIGVKGGTSPYTYSWSPSGGTNTTGSNLAAGNYTVTVTDHNSCTTSATVTITQPSSAVSATISSYSNVPCNGENGTATVTASGGTSPYTYSWTSGAGTSSSVSVAAGSYTVTVKDHNNCTTTASVTITQPAVFQGTITTYNICGSGNTGAISLQMTGGTTPYTYSWTPNVSTTDSASGLSARGYTVMVNDANNCGPLEGTATVSTVTAETVTVTSSNVTCYGSSNGTATASGSPTHSYVWEPGGSTSASISGLAPGSYSVVATETDGCTSNATATITQPTLLTTNISSSSNVTPCYNSSNGSATISASGGTTPYGYSWAPSSGLTGATTTTAGAMSESSYTCTVTDHNGCISSSSITIGGPSAIRDSISSITNVSCNGGNSGSATVGVKGGTSPYTYSWSSSHGTNATASNLAAGSYTCTVTDHNSCVSTATVNITQPSQLRDSISSSTNVLCYGSSTGSATVGVKGGTSSYTYSWSPGGGTNATANNMAAGSYTVTVTDHNSCTTMATVTITQPTSAVSASISSYSNAPCNGENGTAAVTASGGTSPYTYSWSSGYGTHSTASLPAGSYTVTVTDHNSCTTTANITIIQPAVFQGTITTYNICGSGNTGAVSVQLTGGTTPYTYSWTPNVSTTDSAGGLSARGYTVNVNDANNCGPLEGTTTITTITAETVTVTSSNVTCYGGNNGTATASGSPTHSYVWEPGGSTSASISGLAAGSYSVVATETDGCTSNATATVTQPTVISPTTSYTNTCSGTSNGGVAVSVTGGVSPYIYSWSPGGNTTTAMSSLAAGTYTVTVTDHNSCVKTATAMVSSNPLPTLTITPTSSSICAGGSDSIKASGANSYTWAPSTALSVTTGSGVKASPTSTITYTVTGTNSNGCINTQTVTITVNPLPTLTVTPASASICIGTIDSLKVSGASTYTWSPSATLNVSTGTTVAANPTVTTTYTVSGTNSNGCVNTQTVTVTVNPLPTLTVSPVSPAICYGISTSLTAGGASTYTWAPGVGLNVTTGAFVTANLSVTTTYTITGTDANGCVNTQIDTVKINQLPIVSIFPDTSYITIDSSIVLNASGASNYLWSPSTGLNNTSGASVSASPTADSTTYTIIGTNSNTGCSGTQTAVVYATPLLIENPSDTLAAGDTALIEVSGSNTYTWAPAVGLNATTGDSVYASPSVTTSYTVTGTDASGVHHRAVIVIHVVPILPIFWTFNTICPEGSTTLKSSSVATYYSWSPSSSLNVSTGATVVATPSVTTTYTVVGVNRYIIINRNGTFSSFTKQVFVHTTTITVLPSIAVAVSPSINICSAGSTVTLTASGALSYTWQPSNNLSSTSGATVTADPSSSITYTVSGVTPYGCHVAVPVELELAPIEYGTLAKQLDDNFYQTVCGNLYFRYDEEYVSGGDLIYNIYDGANNKLASSIGGPSLGINYKDNYFVINNIASVNSAIQNGYFILEVVNKKGEKEYLRFKN